MLLVMGVCAHVRVSVHTCACKDKSSKLHVFGMRSPRQYAQTHSYSKTKKQGYLEDENDSWFEYVICL